MYGERSGGQRFGGYSQDDGGFQRRSFAPVNVGDELDVKIESVGSQGDGVAKVKGFVLFIPGAKEGQTVRVRITRVLRKAGFAEVIGSASAAGSSEEGSKEEEKEDYQKEEETEEQPAEELSEEGEKAPEEAGGEDTTEF